MKNLQRIEIHIQKLIALKINWIHLINASHETTMYELLSLKVSPWNWISLYRIAFDFLTCNKSMLMLIWWFFNVTIQSFNTAWKHLTCIVVIKWILQLLNHRIPTDCIFNRVRSLEMKTTIFLELVTRLLKRKVWTIQKPEKKHKSSLFS